MHKKKPDNSSPFIRTINPASSAGLINISNNIHLAHLAHVDSKSLREENIYEAMKKLNVTIKTNGKRWYVEYYVNTPEGIRERKREYGGINREKDLTKRMQLIIELQKQIYYQLSNHDNLPKVTYIASTSIYKASRAMQDEKKSYLKLNSYLAICKNIKPWLKFLLDHNLEHKAIHQITTSHILQYRNWRLQQGISNRSVNNNIDEIRTLFNHFMKLPDTLLYKNPCTGITDLPSRSETHVAYTDTEAQLIFDKLKQENNFLLLYIKFVSFVFIRCDEARRLQIKHFDIPNKKLIIPAENDKTGMRKQKLIPKIFIDELISMNLEQYPKEYYLFSSGKQPGIKPVNKDYFTKVYRPYKKKLGLSKLHTIYGFRHTFISQLDAAGHKWSDIMKLTGHTTYTSFEKYMRSVVQRPTVDLSDGFSVKL